MNDEKITLDLVIDVQKDFITGALANTQAHESHGGLHRRI